MEDAMVSENRPDTKEARRSVQSWFNSRRLVLVYKTVSELKRDAFVVKVFHLKLDPNSTRKWNDMNKVFKYRFGVQL